MKFQSTVISLLILIKIGFGFSQTNEIKVRFIGNCGLHFTDGTTDIYIDFPYKSGAYRYMTYDDSELTNLKENAFYIFTHKHKDHYLRYKMRKILKTKKGTKYGKWNVRKLENLSMIIPDFKIEAFATKHNLSFKHYSYLITWHGKKIFLSGDTETAETILTMTDLDWAFVPSWVYLDAMEKKKKIDSKMFGIYHLYPNEKVENSSPEKIKVLQTQGEVITIEY